MKNGRELSKLEQVLRFDNERLSTYVNDVMYKRRQIRIGVVLVRIAEAMYARALSGYFCNGDIRVFKQNCYVASRAYLESAKYDGGGTFATAHSFQLALLSDNPAVIDEFAKLNTTELQRHRTNPRAIESHIYLVQLAMRGDDKVLQEFVNLLRQKESGKRNDMHDLQEFFLLLAAREKDALQRLIQEKHANIKSAHPYASDLMSFIGCLETKLCWLRDIPVEIDHPLVPMALMPVEQLAGYDEVFDFLKPGWVPPPQGPLANALRWIRGKK